MMAVCSARRERKHLGPKPMCAAFIEESRMRFIDANKLHGKSGGMGHPALVAGGVEPPVGVTLSSKGVFTL
jgi:hypothetical protein